MISQALGGGKTSGGGSSKVDSDVVVIESWDQLAQAFGMVGGTIG